MATLSLRVLLFPGDSTVTLEDLPASTTLLQLKTLLITRLPLADGARIPAARFIYGGRLLNADQAHQTLLQLGMPTQGVASLHVVMGGGSSSSSSGSTSSSASGTAPAAAEDAAAAGAEAGAAGGARGFDRLQLIGLDEESIAVLRSLFLPEVLNTMGPHLPREAGETEQQRVLRMEETWMAIQGEGSEFSHNIRPLLRRGAPGGATAPAFQLLPRAGGPLAAAQAWMLHPYVQQTMMHARAAGMSEQDVLRAGYASAARVGLDPAGGGEDREGGGGGGGGREGEEGGAGDARSNLGAIVFGVFVGSFLGWISVFFLLNGSSNRWFKSGITLGILMNLVLLILFPPADSDAGGSGGSGGGSGSSRGGSSPSSSGTWDSPSDSPWAQAVGGGPAPLAPP